MLLPKLLEEVLTRIDHHESKDQAINWVWFQASQAARDEVDHWLVQMKDELAYQAGTHEQRFRRLVQRYDGRVLCLLPYSST